MVINPHCVCPFDWRGKGHTQPHPAPVYLFAALIIQVVALLVDPIPRHLQVYAIAMKRCTLGCIHIGRKRVRMPCCQRLGAPADRDGVALPRTNPPLTGILPRPYQFASCHSSCHDVGICSIHTCQRPHWAALFKPVVSQLVHSRYSHRGRLQRPVIPTVCVSHSAVYRIAGSQQPSTIVGGVGVYRPAGVVKGVIGQKVVAGVVPPVVSVIPVLRLPLHQVVHFNQRTNLRCTCVRGCFRNLLDRSHLPISVLELDAVLSLCIIHIPHPRIWICRILLAHPVLGQNAPVPADAHQFLVIVP